MALSRGELLAIKQTLNWVSAAPTTSWPPLKNVTGGANDRTNYFGVSSTRGI